MPLAGRHAALKMTSVTATSSTDEAATRSTGVSGTGYVQIDSTARRHLDPLLTHTLFDGGTPVSSTAYTLNHVQGKFQWVTGDPPVGTYTADIRWLTASSIGGGRSWELDIQADMFDVSEFGSSGWKRFMPNMTGATATIERFWSDASIFDMANLSHRFIVEFIVNNTAGDKYEAFAYVTSNRPSAAVDQIVGEQITLSIDGQVHFSTA